MISRIRTYPPKFSPARPAGWADLCEGNFNNPGRRVPTRPFGGLDFLMKPGLQKTDENAPVGKVVAMK